jgi:hypothetical protein
MYIKKPHCTGYVNDKDITKQNVQKGEKRINSLFQYAVGGHTVNP